MHVKIMVLYFYYSTIANFAASGIYLKLCSRVWFMKKAERILNKQITNAIKLLTQLGNQPRSKQADTNHGFNLSSSSNLKPYFYKSLALVYIL